MAGLLRLDVALVQRWHPRCLRSGNGDRTAMKTAIAKANSQTGQTDRVEAGLPFVEALARRMAATMPHSIDLSDLVQDGVIGLDRRGAPLRRFARHQVRDLRRAPHPRRDDRRAAQGCVAAWRSPRAPRARSGAREIARLARSRAVARRPRAGGRLRRKAARQDDRPHQHHRIDLAVVERARTSTSRSCRRC